MSTKILLVNVNQCRTPYPVYPLGISHVAAALIEAGHEVLLHDMQCDGERLDKVVNSFGSGVVGVSLRNVDDVDIEKRRFFVPDLLEAVERLRSLTTAPVVIGGSAFSLFPERLMQLSGADYGIRGEGEEAFVRLVSALEQGKGSESIPGVVFRAGNGRVQANPPRACAASAVRSPLRPAELVDYYARTSSMLNVQTQRGCAYRCCYCTYPLIEGPNVRWRDAAAVVDEIAEGVGRGIGYFFVVDSVFNTRKEHVASVCEEIIRRGLEVNWCCFLRPAGLDDELMGLMARAGLRHIEFGSDSFCDSVLDAYGKGITFDDILHSSRLALTHRVRYAHFLIAGGPTETEQTLRTSFENSRRLRRTVVFPYIGMRLYPGTRLYDIALREGAVSLSDDLLEPRYYLTPSLDESRIRALLEEFAAEAKNWVVGELPPELADVTKRLREKGVPGPLWEFLIR